ncbi:unannotated protein [freshwater metagenome]|uniref:Unannotated protein n=1 Tax=freshwater metagenome TaxID=449393 RepID=A0A6J6RWV9_9ZZZZ
MPHLSPRTLTVLAASALLVAGAATTLAPASYAAGETCRGLAATIVGTPDTSVLEGSDGDDVIVAGGAGSVAAGDGDDVICAGDGTLELNGGDGQDILDVTATTLPDGVLLYPGDGDDEVYGGVGDDLVVDGFDASVDHGDDLISTAGGDDTVVSGNFPVEAGLRVDADVIDLGDGDDVLTRRGDPRTTSLTGGGGQDSLAFSAAATPDPAAVLSIDNVAQTARVGEVPLATWDGFESFVVGDADDDPEPVGGVAFRGTGADERLSTLGQAGSLDVRLGGGDDVLDVRLGEYSGQVLGGPGTDLVQASGVRGFTDVAADLAAGRIEWTVSPVGGLDLAAVEDLRVTDADRVSLIGDAVANVFSTDRTCHTRLVGAGGPDLLRVGRPVTVDPDTTQGQRCGASPAVIQGGPGNDRLTGRKTDDVLTGGPGRDVANGLLGRDRCVAEVRYACELR